MKEELARSAQVISKMKGYQDRYKDAKATVSQQERQLDKLSKQNERLKSKNHSLRLKNEAYDSLKEEFAKQKVHLKELEERLRAVTGQGDLTELPHEELKTLSKFHFEGLNRVQVAIDAQTEQMRKMLAESNMCKICFDKPSNVLLLPCSHLIACERTGHEASADLVDSFVPNCAVLPYSLRPSSCGLCR